MRSCIHATEATPLLLGAAVTEATAAIRRWLGDGLLTVAGKPESAPCIDAFRRGGGEGKPIICKSR